MFFQGLRFCFHNKSIANSCLNSSLLFNALSIVLIIVESFRLNFTLSIKKLLSSIDLTIELVYPFLILKFLKIQNITPNNTGIPRRFDLAPFINPVYTKRNIEIPAKPSTLERMVPSTKGFIAFFKLFLIGSQSISCIEL